MKQVLQNYMDDLESNPVFNNDYFKLVTKTKLTPALYELHRANFFYRTMATVMGIAHICGAAAANHDQDTLILFSYILNEECGNGKKSQCHELLMEQSHNLYGEAEFKLPPLGVKDLEGRHDGFQDERAFSLVIDETKAYREKVHFLLTRNYPTMLGVAFALETHASHMLTAFRAMMGLCRTRMDEASYVRNVEIYYNCHLNNGVEDRHAADAKQCILNNCVSEETLNDIIYGINETVKIQQAMWDGMNKKAMELL